MHTDFGGLTKEEGVNHTLSGVYTKVPMTKTFPVYITAAEYATLFAKAGFQLTRVVPTQSPVSVVEATPI